MFELVDESFGKVWVALHAELHERRQAHDASTQAFDRRQLALPIQDAIEAERLAIARDVHDQLGAELTGLRMQLESLAARIQPGAGVAGAELLALADMARSTQLAARDICTRLRPAWLEDLGLKGVQERVLQHNGRFQLKADANGTQVTVTLHNAP